MLPGASVCALVFSHPEAQLLCDVEQIVVRQCHRSWGKLTSGALGLTESFMMLPCASVCGLVFSHPEAQFLRRGADRGTPVPQSWGKIDEWCGWSY